MTRRAAPTSSTGAAPHADVSVGVDQRGEDERYAIAGELTIGDVTRTITLQAEFGGIQPSPQGILHAGFEATGELHRKDFGIGPKMPPARLLGDVVKIELDVQLVEPQPPDAP